MSAILLAAYLAPGWVPSEWNYRWSLPSDPLSDEGLGGLASGDGEATPLGNLEV